VAIGAIGVGGILCAIGSAKREETAVDAIWRLDGNVLYEHVAERMWTGNKAIEPPGPRFLRAVMGDCYFARIQSVSLENDASAAYLDELRGVTDVALHGEHVSDVSLKYVGRLKELRRLDVAGTRSGLKNA
jgi:hypothetical protein